MGYWGSVSGGADLNQDGWDDLVFAAPEENSYTGEIYVSLGPHTGGSINLSLYADILLPGSGFNGYSGQALLLMDDISGDGAADLFAFEGGSYYIASPTTSSSGSISSIAHTVISKSSGSFDTYFASSMSGDWNDDGLEDFAVQGSIYENRIFLGPLPPGYYDESDCSFVLWYSQNMGSADLNGDGYTDLVQSNYYDTDVLFYEGPVTASSVYQGHTATLSDPSASIDFGTWDHLSTPMIHGTDVDGDGTDDLLVGDGSSSISQLYDGAIYVFRGPVLGTVSSADFILSGSSSDRFGIGISSADLNGDGQQDMFSRDYSAASLFYGPLSGDQTTTSASASIPGSYYGTNGYYAHFSPGDLNADGRDDWMVGDSSGVHLFFGTEN